MRIHCDYNLNKSGDMFQVFKKRCSSSEISNIHNVLRSKTLFSMRDVVFKSLKFDLKLALEVFNTKTFIFIKLITVYHEIFSDYSMIKPKS